MKACHSFGKAWSSSQSHNFLGGSSSYLCFHEMKLLGPLPPLPSPRKMPGIVQQTMEMIAGGYYEICQKQLCVSMGLFYCNPFPFRSARMDGGQDDGRNMFSFLFWFTDSCILGSAVPVLGGYTTIVLVFTGVISPPFWVFNHTCTHLQPQLHPKYVNVFLHPRGLECADHLTQGGWANVHFDVTLCTKRINIFDIVRMIEYNWG